MIGRNCPLCVVLCPSRWWGRLQSQFNRISPVKIVFDWEADGNAVCAIYPHRIRCSFSPINLIPRTNCHRCRCPLFYFNSENVADDIELSSWDWFFVCFSTALCNAVELNKCWFSNFLAHEQQRRPRACLFFIFFIFLRSFHQIAFEDNAM